MTFDEQHGWVERGTRGHHASAQGDDVDAEVAALDRIHAHPMHNAFDTRWRRLAVTVWGSTVQQIRAAVKRPARPADRNDPVIARAIARRARRAADYIAGFDVGHGSTTVMTTYAVEGDTLRIVHNVQLPVRAQTVDVTMTIGGE